LNQQIQAEHVQKHLSQHHIAAVITVNTTGERFPVRMMEKLDVQIAPLPVAD
jgi:hypothetical protein